MGAARRPAALPIVLAGTLSASVAWAGDVPEATRYDVEPVEGAALAPKSTSDQQPGAMAEAPPAPGMQTTEVAVPLPRPRDRAPIGAAALVALAVHPDRAGSLAVADRAGNIWRTDTGGARWLALREAGSGSGLPTREDLLLDLDVRLGELVHRAGLDDPSRDPADDAWRQAELRDELLADHELLPGFVFRDLPGAAAAAVDLRFVDGVLWARLADGWWVERGATLVPAPAAPPDPVTSPPPSWLPQATLSADCTGLSPVAAGDGGLFELRPAGPRPVDALGGSPSPLSLACDASGALWVLTSQALWSFQQNNPATRRASSLDLPALLDAAASRVGLRPQSLRSRRTWAAFTPTLVAEATVGAAQVDRWAGALGTVGQELLGSGVVVRAVWQPRAPGRAASWRTRGDLVVIDGEVLPLTGRDDHVALSSLARAAHRYTAQVQRVVANLVDERAVLEGREPGASTLPEQVQVALAVAEVDALLDALCDGAASRAPRAP